ncbi:MAG: FAD-dependent oxidoreductase, partial [Myxococcales bacterium]|nr:FAD-dependent oxidoreductase [Myxococcales bacterium]
GIRWGHALRDGPPELGSPVERRVDVAVIGGGIAGLTAAWRLLRGGVPNLVVLEADRSFGGTSRAGESPVTAYPWGAHYAPAPSDSKDVLHELLLEMGVVDPTSSESAPRYDPVALITEPEERCFHRGRWHPGLWPFSDGEGTKERDRFFRSMRDLAALSDEDGRPAFRFPQSMSSDRPTSPRSMNGPSRRGSTSTGSGIPSCAGSSVTRAAMTTGPSPRICPPGMGSRTSRPEATEPQAGARRSWRGPKETDVS